MDLNIKTTEDREPHIENVYNTHTHTDAHTLFHTEAILAVSLSLSRNP